MNIRGEETIKTFNKEIGNIKIKTELENTKKNQSEIKKYNNSNTEYITENQQ